MLRDQRPAGTHPTSKSRGARETSACSEGKQRNFPRTKNTEKIGTHTGAVVYLFFLRPCAVALFSAVHLYQLAQFISNKSAGIRAAEREREKERERSENSPTTIQLEKARAVIRSIFL